MSSNTFGDATLAPFNSTYVPNLQTPVGELDLDWYTDLQGWGAGVVGLPETLCRFRTQEKGRL